MFTFLSKPRKLEIYTTVKKTKTTPKKTNQMKIKSQKNMKITIEIKNNILYKHYGPII